LKDSYRCPKCGCVLPKKDQPIQPTTIKRLQVYLIIDRALVWITMGKDLMLFQPKKIGLKEKTPANLFIFFSSTVSTTHLLPLLPLLNSYAFFFLQKSLNTLQRVYMYIVQKRGAKNPFLRIISFNRSLFCLIYPKQSGIRVHMRIRGQNRSLWNGYENTREREKS